MFQKKLDLVQSNLQEHFAVIKERNMIIRDKLSEYAGGKSLKGDEVVGWLGEIYGKILLGGKLVRDECQHDVETRRGWRVSVKTRKGKNKGWNLTSAIPKIEGSGCPTHLMFVHLNEDFLLERIWLYPWRVLRKLGRFMEHRVHGNLRSYRFSVQSPSDERYLVYPLIGDHWKSART